MEPQGSRGVDDFNNITAAMYSKECEKLVADYLIANSFANASTRYISFHLQSSLSVTKEKNTKLYS